MDTTVSSPAASAAPLAGITVIEIGTAMAGPFCALTLADYGAEVIKIEPIEGGDWTRNSSPEFPGGVAHYFAAANRNKRSVALDLKSPRGVEVIKRLAATADVLVNNFRFGALDRLGLGYPDLAALNPRLIYCNISGFGATGPRAREAGNDVLMQAFAGNMSITGEEEGGPCKCGISIADIGGGLYGAIGVLLALEARNRTGRGQFVDTSLLEGQIAMLSYHVTRFFASGKPPERQGSGMRYSPSSRAFRAKDDWFAIAAMSDRMWDGVCRAVGRPEWLKDPNYRTRPGRRRHSEVLIAELRRIFAGETVAVWMERLTAEGVPCSPVNGIEKMVQEEQVRARDMIVEVQHPTAGAIRMAGLPIKLSETPGSIRRHPPLLGEHSEGVLRELGYGGAEIDRMRQDGVIGAKAAMGAGEEA